MQIPKNALIAVVDGAKLLLFRNAGDAQHPKLETVHHSTQADPPSRDLASDAPGRSHASAGGGRAAHDEGDPHQQRESAFAKDAAALLDRLARDNWVETAIIVAAPRTLGELRQHFSKALKSRIEGELAKDLTGLSVLEIERHLAAA